MLEAVIALIVGDTGQNVINQFTNWNQDFIVML